MVYDSINFLLTLGCYINLIALNVQNQIIRKEFTFEQCILSHY